MNEESTYFIWVTITAATKFIPCTYPSYESKIEYNFKTVFRFYIMLTFYEPA